MGRIVIIVVFILVFLGGLSFLLYPSISDYFNSIEQTRAVNKYYQAMENLSDQDHNEILEAAQEYNTRLTKKANRFIMTDDEKREYRKLLDPAGIGVMGALEIETININLPIYHGTSEGVLQVGLGHLEGSSLPVGGPNTHAVITGHRGLPSSTLLTHLDRLVPGDIFNINVLGETLIYMVDNMTIILPQDTSELTIISGADYCTLVTCTPYGINTHRLLVRGHRIDVLGTEIHARPSRIPLDAHVLTGATAALLIVVPMALVVLVILFIRLRRVYGRGKKL